MRFLLNNFWLKFAALILSISCWFYVKGATKEAVYTEDLISKEIPISVTIEGEPQEGFEVRETEIIVNPESIFIIGPKKSVESVPSIKTLPISVSGFSKTFTKKTKLVPFNDTVSFEEEFIEATIPIRKSP